MMRAWITARVWNVRGIAHAMKWQLMIQFNKERAREYMRKQNELDRLYVGTIHHMHNGASDDELFATCMDLFREEPHRSTVIDSARRDGRMALARRLKKEL